jgi:hypothetical protein
MNIFNRKKRLEINDDVLGMMTFLQPNIVDEDCWNFKRKTASTNEEVEYFVYNNSDGVTEEQRNLIVEIERNYADLVDCFQVFLDKKLSEFDYQMSIKDDLKISFINIPENPTKLYEWEINYEEKEGFAIYSIGVENYIPVDLGISM